MRTSFLSVVCSVVAALSLSVSTAAAQDAGAQLSLELNNASPTEAGGCRLIYIAVNQSDVALTQAAYQVGVFDSSGVVSAILTLDFGALPTGRTRLYQFDLNQACTDLSRILVDTAVVCTQEDGTSSDFCISGLATASRTDIQFGL